MKKILVFIGILISLGFTSCIEITEEIQLQSDKSGTATFKVDLGALGILASVVTKFVDISLFESLKEFPNSASKNLKGVKGVSKIQALNMPNKGIYGIRFDFENEKALNRAVYQLIEHPKKWYEPGLYNITGSKMQKRDIGPIVRYYYRKNQSKIKDYGSLQLVSWNSVYHLPGVVKKTKPDFLSVSSDKKTVKYSITLDKMLQEKHELGQKIIFSK